MLNAADKPTAGFDGRLNIRAPSDLMPTVHAFARRRGMTSASWVRSVIMEALERGGAYQPSERDAA